MKGKKKLSRWVIFFQSDNESLKEKFHGKGFTLEEDLDSDRKKSERGKKKRKEKKRKNENQLERQLVKSVKRKTRRWRKLTHVWRFSLRREAAKNKELRISIITKTSTEITWASKKTSFQVLYVRIDHLRQSLSQPKKFYSFKFFFSFSPFFFYLLLQNQKQKRRWNHKKYWINSFGKKF